MKNTYKIASLITFVILIASPILSFAGGPGFGGGVDDGGGACAAPLDGGMSLLIAAGIGYGAKKIADNKKARKESADK